MLQKHSTNKFDIIFYTIPFCTFNIIKYGYFSLQNVLKICMDFCHKFFKSIIIKSGIKYLKILCLWTSNKSLCGLSYSTIIKKVKPTTKTISGIQRLSFNYISFSYKQPVPCYFIQVNISLLYATRLWTGEELLSCWICRYNHCSVTKICIISKKSFHQLFVYIQSWTHECIYIYTHVSYKIHTEKRFNFSSVIIVFFMSQLIVL